MKPNRMLYALMLTIAVLSLTACGKSLDQVRQVAHDLIDIAGKTYEDMKDNVEAAKKVVLPASPAKP